MRVGRVGSQTTHLKDGVHRHNGWNYWWTMTNLSVLFIYNFSNINKRDGMQQRIYKICILHLVRGDYTMDTWGHDEGSLYSIYEGTRRRREPHLGETSLARSKDLFTCMETKSLHVVTLSKVPTQGERSMLGLLVNKQTNLSVLSTYNLSNITLLNAESS